MSTTNAVVTVLFSLLAWSGAYSQDVVKAKHKASHNCKGPKVKVTQRDGILVVTSKDLNGYHKIKRTYYFDDNCQRYYYMSGDHRLYYDSDWKPY